MLGYMGFHCIKIIAFIFSILQLEAPSCGLLSTFRDWLQGSQWEYRRVSPFAELGSETRVIHLMVEETDWAKIDKFYL